MKTVTLADIARETGYSVNTISHALNDKSDISDKTKQYIVQTARDMGYIANSAASSLRSGKSKSVAIIVGDISNPHFAILIKEMEHHLREYGYNAFILNTDEDEQLEHDAIVSAISKKVDGILLCPVQKSRRNLTFLQKCKIPYILFGRRFSQDSSGYIICDDFNGGYIAAQHLIDLNHRQILFIHAPLYISSAQERLDGIQKAVAACNECQLKAVEISTMGSIDNVQMILKAHPQCTGIICFSDMIALQVCHVLKLMNRRVPEDVSVIGFDNIVSKFYFPLMLSSVTSSKTNMSVQVVDKLMNIIDSDLAAVPQIVLPTKIVMRESTQKSKEST